MTEDKNGWPDPSRPGVPLHPKRDGWHWLQFEGAPKPFPWCWLPATETDPVAAWGSGDGRELTTAGAAKRWRYLGPCLTPADLAAERDERMREEGSREAFVKAAEHLRRVALSYDRNGANQAAGGALRGEAEFIEMLAAETRARSEGKG